MKKCIIILGMHRSGTSSVAGSLYNAGINLGDNLFGKKMYNPRGLFEDRYINELNKSILLEHNSDWNRLFDPGKVSNERINKFILDLSIYFSKFNTDVFAIKDPRISILLPLYIRFFEKEGITPFFVHITRSHLDIALSLNKRDNMPFFYGCILSKYYQYLITKYSNQIAIAYSTNYLEFISDPIYHIKRILDVSSVQGNIDTAPILNFVTKDLNNNSYNNHSFYHRFLYYLSIIFFPLFIQLSSIGLDRLFLRNTKLNKNNKWNRLNRIS